MARQTVIPKKKRGPKPTGVGTPIMVRMQPDQLAKVDRWRDAQFADYTRPDAVRELVDLGLDYGLKPDEQDKMKRKR